MAGERTDPNSIVGEINAAHGFDFAVQRRFESGLQGGAWLLAEPDGRRAVLKLGPPDIDALAAAVRRISAAGYPVPAWLASGVSASGSAYHVQNFVEGVSATPLTSANTAALLAVLERQAGLDPGREVRWSQQIHDLVYADEMRSTVINAGGAQLIDAFGLRPVRLPDHDLVHGDFNSCNLLMHDGGAGGVGVSGVIDIDAIGRGTRVFDYACLLREAFVEGYGEGVTTQIHRAALPIAGRDVLAMCCAAAVFFIIRFKLAHEPHRIGEVIERSHALARLVG